MLIVVLAAIVFGFWWFSCPVTEEVIPETVHVEVIMIKFTTAISLLIGGIQTFQTIASCVNIVWPVTVDTLINGPMEILTYWQSFGNLQCVSDLDAEESFVLKSAFGKYLMWIKYFILF